VTVHNLIAKEIDYEALAFAIARNQCGARDSIEAVLAQENISTAAFMRIADDPLFKQQVQRFVRELNENGVSFQLKARIQAEELLKKQFVLIHDPDTPPAVAVKAIENTVRWAGLEPKVSQNGSGGADGPKFQIVFNLDAPAKPEKIIKSVEIDANDDV
jgi:hypothetical protein